MNVFQEVVFSNSATKENKFNKSIESELACADVFLTIAEREGIEMARAELALAKAKDKLNQLRKNQLGI
ncbi:hypothetical protein B0186_04825 [Canicola haemoglobinophilus]|uniref:Uncharacterized protein n=1 Tax=Canicola haemoglobinophilus TaxID=733 RepID=A0A1V4B1N2_9PAST|nr:hypothetical protein [Canicola haemoglobinophilus]OOS01064.1 hypothetical protein B0186_04825 [Canicola haemoglobinophilus]STO60301.1 Uncharacterised protein [Canicola haemoglobinophilus]